MRFAFVATCAAAAVAVPFAVSAAGPQMSGDQFVSAVECAAYQDITRDDADLGALKVQLNAEARRQPAQTVAEAQAAVSGIARQAVSIEMPANGAMLSPGACLSGQTAMGARASDAV